MVRFSARGAYLLLVPQGRALIRDRALIWNRARISFRETTECSDRNFNTVYIQKTEETVMK